jgi:hypothetical protein
VGATRLYGVGRSAFFREHEFHPAFRTAARMISYDFGMHRAGVFLFLMLLIVLVLGLVLVMRVLCDHRRHERAGNR